MKFLYEIHTKFPREFHMGGAELLTIFVFGVLLLWSISKSVRRATPFRLPSTSLHQPIFP